MRVIGVLKIRESEILHILKFVYFLFILSSKLDFGWDFANLTNNTKT